MNASSSVDPAQIDLFINHLATAVMPPDTVNPYAADNIPNNAVRRANLRRYLEQMMAIQPRLLLVLEAPSYRGMRVTGVPAVGQLLTEGIPQFGLFGSDNGYRTVDEPGFMPPKSNQTASALWGTLVALGEMALVWNTFPFHPHQPGNPLSNRTPRASEIGMGIPFLNELMGLFTLERVIAVGNIAERALTLIEIEHIKIRHPAQGGKTQFVAGLRAVFGTSE